jgi:ribosomal protein S18 acetylase RimI-like enzyme
VRVQLATEADISAWIALAVEVEPLFGPHAHSADFQHVLRKNIARGSAFCVRADEGLPGTHLLGGLLFSAHPPHYKISWLAVAASARGQGIGRALVRHALSCVVAPAEISVITFGEDVAEGEAARRLYQALGFEPAQVVAPGPEGGSRQVFRRRIDAAHGL